MSKQIFFQKFLNMSLGYIYIYIYIYIYPYSSATVILSRMLIRTCVHIYATKHRIIKFEGRKMLSDTMVLDTISKNIKFLRVNLESVKVK